MRWRFHGVSVLYILLILSCGLNFSFVCAADDDEGPSPPPPPPAAEEVDAPPPPLNPTLTSESAAASRSSSKPSWKLLPYDVAHNCIPVIPSHLADEDVKLATLLRVYSLYSGGSVTNFAMNLVESMLSSFPERQRQTDGMPPSDPTSTSSSSSRSHSVSDFVTCELQWQQRLKSFTHTTPKSYWRYHSVGNRSTTMFDGLCVGFVLWEPYKNKRSNSANSAVFGSSRYYSFLQKKIRIFSSLLIPPRSHRVSPWALLVDSDTQVFPGFFQMLNFIAKCPYAALHHSVSNFKMQSGELRASSTVDVFFQRESAKSINSGTVFVNTQASGGSCLYEKGVELFQPIGTGDQKALQKAIKLFRRGICYRNSASYPLVVETFNRLEVGANPLQPLLFVAHHAHMSGSRKRDNLREVLRAMYAVNVSTHTGRFLSNNVQCPPPTGQEWMKAVETTCELFRVERRLFAAEKSDNIQTNAEAISSAANSGTPSTARSLFEVVRDPREIVVNSTHNSNSTSMSWTKKKLKSKPLFAALPALVIVLTITVYHCFLRENLPADS